MVVNIWTLVRSSFAFLEDKSSPFYLNAGRFNLCKDSRRVCVASKVPKTKHASFIDLLNRYFWCILLEPFFHFLKNPSANNVLPPIKCCVALEMTRYEFRFCLGIHSYIDVNFHWNLIICCDGQFSGSACLMNSFPSSSDKKTLKRWFFIDKRVG
jgi:hypothetical protein